MKVLLITCLLVLLTGRLDGLQTNCTTVCLAIYDPVCGTDGHTYSNVCTLEATACTTGQNIEVKYFGECEE